MTDTAFEQKLRIDRRLARARKGAAQFFFIIEKYVPDACRQDAYDELINAFHTTGAEIIGDADRDAAGLAPRGPDGWTLEEIAAYDRAVHAIGYEITRTPLILDDGAEERARIVKMVRGDEAQKKISTLLREANNATYEDDATMVLSAIAELIERG